jgi:hypothetical protein
MPGIGYSGAPLVQKLGLKAGQRVFFLNPPANYPRIIGKLPKTKILRRLPSSRAVDFIQAFFTARNQLSQIFPRLQASLAWAGILWISWPKGASKVATDLNENIVREIGLDTGMVDVKVAAIDEVWSGLKFVHRVIDRPK